MRIFVAGKKGMLASDLTPFLESKGEVKGGDLPDFDITDINRISNELAEFRPDLVINCAAYTAVDKAEEEAETAYGVNGSGAENLAVVCRELESKLIHISTDFVFDGKKNRPYNENDTPNPLSVYGKSKLEGETKIQEVTDRYLIVRTSWLYGQAGGNFVKTIIRLAKEREELGIVFDQVGTPTYTADLAAGIIELIDKDVRGIYHFSNEGVCSWYDFAYEVISNLREKGEIMKLKRLKPILSKEYPTPAARPPYSVLDKSKYKTSTSNDIPHWRDGLRRFFDELEQRL